METRPSTSVQPIAKQPSTKTPINTDTCKRSQRTVHKIMSSAISSQIKEKGGAHDLSFEPSSIPSARCNLHLDKRDPASVRFHQDMRLIMDHVCTLIACIPEITDPTSVVNRVTLPSSIIRIMLQFLRVLGR